MGSDAPCDLENEVGAGDDRPLPSSDSVFASIARRAFGNGRRKSKVAVPRHMIADDLGCRVDDLRNPLNELSMTGKVCLWAGFRGDRERDDFATLSKSSADAIGIRLSHNGCQWEPIDSREKSIVRRSQVFKGEDGREITIFNECDLGADPPGRLEDQPSPEIDDSSDDDEECKSRRWGYNDSLRQFEQHWGVFRPVYINLGDEGTPLKLIVDAFETHRICGACGGNPVSNGMILGERVHGGEYCAVCQGTPQESAIAALPDPKSMASKQKKTKKRPNGRPGRKPGERKGA